MKDLLLRLATAIRESVRPWVLEARGGEVVGRAHSGDATFKIDEIAEQHLSAFLALAHEPVACFSEDKGLVIPRAKKPEWLLVVDPIDGSRNAKSGFEACMVSVALARFGERPTLADVTHGVLSEIVGTRVFYAEKNGPVEMTVDGKPSRPALSDTTDLNLLRWSLTMPGRPASLVFKVMGNLVDTSSVKGGFFSCNSTCYSISRIVTGQLDAYVDIANRILRDAPQTENIFRHIAYGRLTGFSSYDIAAAHLIAKQAGVFISDAYGNSLENMLLLDTSPANLRSCVAASNEALHQKLLEYVNDSMNALKGLSPK
ncbi:MAG: bifunctional fructose-bisphosphatase/inositol-phosphate phosphatase [Candidatus Abyssubacteria bacterium]